jgi:ketosteroid isomerase-like protein
MLPEPINAADAPAPGGGYGQAVRVSGAGGLLFVSGQVPVGLDNGGPAAFGDQFRLVWAKVEAQLRAAGKRLADIRPILAIVFLSLGATSALAQESHTQDERQAVLATVDGLFAAMLARDGAAVTSLVEPQGMVTSISAGADGSRQIASSSWSEFAARLAQAPAPIRERLFDPEVRIRGDLAMVWSRYDLSIGATFSHCGTDLFDLVRRDGRWRLLHASFTRERIGCEAR